MEDTEFGCVTKHSEKLQTKLKPRSCNNQFQSRTLVLREREREKELQKGIMCIKVYSCIFILYNHTFVHRSHIIMCKLLLFVFVALRGRACVSMMRSVIVFFWQREHKEHKDSFETRNNPSFTKCLPNFTQPASQPAMQKYYKFVQINCKLLCVYVLSVNRDSNI